MDWQIVSPHEFELSRTITRRTHNKQQADHPRLHHYAGRYSKRARGAHTFPLCSRNVTVWQVRSQHIQRRIVRRILAGTPAQGRVKDLCQ